MVNLDQVEKLRQRANISYDEAKAALEETNGDILEAIINLEKQDRIKSPEGGGYYNSRMEKEKVLEHSETKEEYEPKENGGTSFGELLGKFFRFCGKIIKKGNRNYFEIIKNGENIITLPITVLVVLLIFAFWIVIPLLIVGLFFGYRYIFDGPELGKENVNRAMDSVADAAENFKKDVKGEESNGENTDNRR